MELSEDKDNCGTWCVRPVGAVHSAATSASQLPASPPRMLHLQWEHVSGASQRLQLVQRWHLLQRLPWGPQQLQWSMHHAGHRDQLWVMRQDVRQ